LPDVAAHKVANAVVGVNQPAGDLIAPRRRCLKRERNRHAVAAFFDKYAAAHAAVEIDALAIEPRRRAGLQTPHLEAQGTKRLGEIARRRLAVASGRTLLAADVNQSVEECAGRDDERIALMLATVFHRDSDDAASLRQHATGLAEDPGDVRLG